MVYFFLASEESAGLRKSKKNSAGRNLNRSGKFAADLLSVRQLHSVVVDVAVFCGNL